MKHLLGCLFLIPFFGFSQCPPDGAFNSQAEINAFALNYPNCTTLGALIIEGNDITDLSGLNQITFALTLTIWNNPLLQNLDGLNPNLEIYDGYQASFSISDNASLNDISALLTTSISAGVDLYVYIGNNPLLNSLNGLQAIPYATTFNIFNNDSLTNLVGIGDNIAELTIDDNDGLLDLSGLQDFLGEYLNISNNAILQSFNVIGATGATYVMINNNPNLTDISLPENSGAVSLIIEGNTNLSMCNVDFVCNYLNSNPPLFAVSFNNNAPNCNSYQEVEYACGLIPRNDDCESDYPTIVEIGETITVNNELATTSIQTPSCNEVAGRKDLWFSFNTGTFTSVDIIAETGISLQLWEGDCNNLIQVDNSCASVSLTNIPVAQSTNYTLQAWSETNKRPAGWFDLTVQDGLLSTPENVSNEINIYPNPVNRLLKIKAKHNISSVVVFDIFGQRLLELTPTIKNTEVDMRHLASGLYLVEVNIGKQKEIYKIIKE